MSDSPKPKMSSMIQRLMPLLDEWIEEDFRREQERMHEKYLLEKIDRINEQQEEDES